MSDSSQEQNVQWRRSSSVLPDQSKGSPGRIYKSPRVRLRRSSKNEALKSGTESTQRPKRGKKGVFIHFCDICNKVRRSSGFKLVFEAHILKKGPYSRHEHLV